MVIIRQGMGTGYRIAAVAALSLLLVSDVDAATQGAAVQQVAARASLADSLAAREQMLRGLRGRYQ
jgi:hypothetical protein